MAVSFGRAEIDVDVNGDSLPEETRALGEEAGSGAGDGFSKGWFAKLKSLGSKTASEMKKNGKLGGKEFDKGFESKDIEKLAGQLDKLGEALKRNRVQVENHGASMKHWQAITLAVTALIVGAGNDIAVLGSAVGAGVTVLAGGAVALAAGAGVLVAAFSGLNQAIDDVPDAAKPAAKALSGLKDEFKDLRNSITVATFKNSASAFDSLRSTVKGLTPAIESLGESAGRVFDSFAKGLAPGTRGFQTLNKIIQQAGPIFEHIAQVAGNFAQAIGSALASPRLGKSINQLLDWLDGLASAFDKFASGTGLDEWLNHADIVFGAVGNLASSLGTTLNGLVTDKTVKQTADFVNSLADFLPIAGQLIDTIGSNLDPLGLISQALNDIGDAIQPLLGPLGDLGTSLHNVASIMIDEWGKALGDISDNLAPVVQDMADFLAGLDEGTIRKIADALLAFAAAAVILKGAKGIANLAGKLTDLATGMDSVIKKGPKFQGVAGGIAASLAAVTASQATGGDPLATILGGTLTGTAVAGPIGAAVGAIISTIISIFTDHDKWVELTNWWNTFWLTQTAVIAQWAQNLGVQVTVWGQQLIMGIGNWFTSIYTNFIVWVATFAQGWADWFNGLYTGALTWLATIWIGFTGWLAEVLNGFLTWGAGVIGWWNDLWTGVWNFIVSIWNTIVTWVAAKVAGFVANLKGAFNGVSDWWNGLWSGISSFFSDVWNNIVSGARSQINSVIGFLNGLVDKINDVLSGIKSLTGGLVNLHIPNIPNLPKTATGGIFNGAQARILGEAGPEMVVPLSRDLSRVDPAVRDVARYAQGRGGNTGPTKQITVESGAVQVIYSGTDPELVGTSAMDRLIAKFA